MSSMPDLVTNWAARPRAPQQGPTVKKVHPSTGNRPMRPSTTVGAGSLLLTLTGTWSGVLVGGALKPRTDLCSSPLWKTCSPAQHWREAGGAGCSPNLTKQVSGTGHCRACAIRAPCTLSIYPEKSVPYLLCLLHSKQPLA